MSDNFVYFDIAHACGALHGNVQVEISAHALDTTSEGTIDLRIVEVARLRCSTTAARGLIKALADAIKLAENPEQSGPRTSKAN